MQIIGQHWGNISTVGENDTGKGHVSNGEREDSIQKRTHSNIIRQVGSINVAGFRKHQIIIHT